MRMPPPVHELAISRLVLTMVGRRRGPARRPGAKAGAADRSVVRSPENVGNLVCPAAFDLGQHRNVTLLSVTEGDDKPAKYPVMFHASDLVLIAQFDLAPIIDDFGCGRAEAALHRIACPAPVLAVSARRRVGMDAWLDWVRAEAWRPRSSNTSGRACRVRDRTR